MKASFITVKKTENNLFSEISGLNGCGAFWK